MRAVAVADFGAEPEVMDLPAPVPGPGEFLVHLRAAGVNPFDWKVAEGLLRRAVHHSFPLILGSDGAGTVHAVGEGVSAFRPGERVYGQFLRIPQGLGSYSEYTLATEEDAVARMPEGMLFTQAAAVPTATMTAYGLVEAAGVDAGQKVLVVGATGGVGQSVVQFARDRGATVAATAAGAEAEAWMRHLGAAEVLDHTRGPITERLLELCPDGVHTVIDLVQDAEGVAALLPAVHRPGGTVASTQGALDTGALAERGITGINYSNRGSARLLAVLADLIDAGRLRVHIDHEADLEDAPSALTRLRSGGARGKTVLRI
ncbi:NADP-dependent oxidoreductase [Nocardiopsis sp. RSe5-2]|uniref:NADP-dependent oxidoreductase n=1 Tax=Nocardiopsis endophytica TaxID=3018445 RepID=A0ABT4U6Y6_9ACTN|nr:NADP-dependent oxidoreductase [Nocardiopsis endophytica]MDA2812481.1 NADP-dependent oxidoreductase [Nocardiopsis endophytica]